MAPGYSPSATVGVAGARTEPVLERVLQSKTTSLPFTPAIGTTDYTVGHFGLDPGTTPRQSSRPLHTAHMRLTEKRNRPVNYNTRFG